MSRRGRARALCAGVVAWASIASVSDLRAASAATIGGLSAPALTASSFAASTGAKSVLIWENFNAASGSNIAGTVTDGGSATWSVNPAGGSWTVNANQARSTTANSSVVVQPAPWNYTSVVTAFRGGTSFDGGLTTNRNSAGTQFISCEWTSGSNGSMELWKYVSGTWTQWASVTNLYPSGWGTAPASIQVGCGTDATSAYAMINGVVVASYTLTAAERSMFFRNANRRTGPYQWLATTMTFDDFHVDVP